MAEGKERVQNTSTEKATETIGKGVKKLKKTKVSMFSVIIVAAILVAIVFFVLRAINSTPGEQVVDVVSTLEKVVKNSTLSTYEVVYNGVATVHNEKKPEKIDYYVAYTATVKAGFDFQAIDISKDDENKEIVVNLPPIELKDPIVKIEDLDYIVIGRRVKEETISQDAYKRCIADVAEESKKQAAIYSFAKENGERLIKGLISPFVDQLDGEYTVKFVWRES